MFYQNFIRLCNERKVSPNAVASAIGISNGTATGWKNGAVPQQRTLMKIADYFGVPLETLLEDKKSPAAQNGGEALDELDGEFISLITGLSPDQRSFLLSILRAAVRDPSFSKI